MKTQPMPEGMTPAEYAHANGLGCEAAVLSLLLSMECTAPEITKQRGDAVRLLIAAWQVRFGTTGAAQLMSHADPGLARLVALRDANGAPLRDLNLN